ncbi:uncharacterized protein BKA55DRAFT_537419 [Fusarium redolens]|uniref:Uncharacterized protein n=1 Tax=Fusarium redolens TaxID=48865 RepID=A0A9P9HN77_FUSRE|nr:uncharacterized protein BKA55DRAFT_537419 [Fusarium redolens]KAH7259732.1 hypothetical protein BKA55DRAFT_537419 [Fusarium redolens]
MLLLFSTNCISKKHRQFLWLSPSRYPFGINIDVALWLATLFGTHSSRVLLYKASLDEDTNSVFGIFSNRDIARISNTRNRATKTSQFFRADMCRMMIFRGHCTRCDQPQTWVDLTQELSCLDAKNNGWFGGCRRGILVEEHDFNQECSICHEEDEGIGGLDDSHVMPYQQTPQTQSSLGKRAAGDRGGSSDGSKKQRT